MVKHWIGVASADHVAHGRAGGFMQVCHGKKGPLSRIKAADQVFYYSPSQIFGSKERLQKFTAAGIAADESVYSFDMGGGFVPFRRNVIWHETNAAPIQPLLDQLEFTRGRTSWGYAFRYGLLEISDADAGLIWRAMDVNPQPSHPSARQDPE